MRILIRFISRCIIFFEVVISGFFFRLRFNLLLVCRNAVDFYLLILNPAAVLNSYITSSLKNDSVSSVALVLPLPFLAVKCGNRGADAGRLRLVLLFLVAPHSLWDL